MSKPGFLMSTVTKFLTQIPVTPEVQASRVNRKALQKIMDELDAKQARQENNFEMCKYTDRLGQEIEKLGEGSQEAAILFAEIERSFKEFE
jgi:hypothetical protein